MELIKDGAEQHLLAALGRLEDNPQGWLCFSFSFSKMLDDHGTLVAAPSKIPERIAEIEAKRAEFVSSLERAASAVNPEGYVYVMADLDVFALLNAGDGAASEAINALYTEMTLPLPEGFSEAGSVAAQLGSYQKYAERKLLGAKKMEAYRAMGDPQKTSTIPARRKRRTEPLVLIVEDDKFTAHYAASLLGREYGLVLSGTGEEAIDSYIKTAPDVIMIDIHLPGLSGHEVLAAVRAIDPDGYVVMLSADCVMDNIVRAAESGANKFLKKPLDRAKVIETVKSSPHIKAQQRTG